jgi:hypothetical protein
MERQRVQVNGVDTNAGVAVTVSARLHAPLQMKMGTVWTTSTIVTVGTSRGTAIIGPRGMAGLEKKAFV